MATKTFCDRCGKEGKAVLMELITPDETLTGFDLCRSCREALETLLSEWLGRKAKTQSRRETKNP